jgi:hypothetical protein
MHFAQCSRKATGIRIETMFQMIRLFETEQQIENLKSAYIKAIIDFEKLLIYSLSPFSYRRLPARDAPSISTSSAA